MLKKIKKLMHIIIFYKLFLKKINIIILFMWYIGKNFGNVQLNVCEEYSLGITLLTFSCCGASRIVHCFNFSSVHRFP